MNRNKKFYDKNKFKYNFNIQGLKIENKKRGFIALTSKCIIKCKITMILQKVLNKF